MTYSVYLHSQIQNELSLVILTNSPGECQASIIIPMRFVPAISDHITTTKQTEKACLVGLTVFGDCLVWLFNIIRSIEYEDIMMHLPERLQIFAILLLFQKRNGTILVSFAMRNVFLSFTGSGRSTLNGKEITLEGQ